MEGKNDTIKNYLVSICCLAYNHEDFIKETLNGFLMQKTNFPFEIVIHDDASTDKTATIIKEYVEKYPSVFNPLFQTKNQKSIYKSGMNPRFNFPRAKGKYIAICEGDDYWTDPYKLQKQVDFLEKNPDFNICFTRTELLKNNQLQLHKIPEKENGIYTFDDLLLHENFIATASVIFRNNFNKIPDWFSTLPHGDMAVYLIVGRDTKIKCLQDTTAVYRIHESGVWQQQNKNQKMINKLIFNQGIFNQLTKYQKTILSKKQIKLIEQLAALKYPVNKVFRVIYRSFLKLKYSLS